MTRKDVVALAEMLQMHNRTADGRTEFTADHLRVLSDFCAAQYPTFNRERWIDYIAGVNRQGGSPKRGPRLMANRRQREVLQSLLRELRRDASLRQKDVAKALGKPQTFVSFYENGARRLDLLELRNVCQVLGISLGGFVRKFEKRLLDPSFKPDDSQVTPGHVLPTEVEKA